MQFFRTEAHDDGAEAAYQRLRHGLGTTDAPHAEGPREALRRTLDGIWRPDHRPATLREEIADSDLNPRQRLALRIRDLWRGAR